MEHNRERVVAIRSGLIKCSDKKLRRSLAEGRLSTLAHVASRSARGSLWSYVDVEGLLDVVRDFHRRSGTLTPKVSANIDRISEPSIPLVRFAHTPDFLPYVGVLSNLVLCEALSDLTNPSAVPIALMIDVDTVEDNRMRKALLPGSYPLLSIDVPKRLRRRAAGIVAPPSYNEVVKLVAHLSILAERQQGSIGISKLIDHVNYAAMRAKSFGDFSSMVWSRLINLDAGLGTVFIHQIAAAPFLSSAWARLPEYEKEVAAANESACSTLLHSGFKPDKRLFSKIKFWSLCSNCGRRIIFRVADQEKCPCGSNCSIRVPALAADVLGDWIIWGFAAGSSYLGSSSHVLVSLKVAELLGVSDWTEILWAGNAVATGVKVSDPFWIDPADARQGRVSIVAELCNESMASWSASWHHHLLDHGLNVHRAAKGVRFT